MQEISSATRLYLDECLNPECDGVAVFCSVWDYPKPIMNTTVICTKCGHIIPECSRHELDIIPAPNPFAGYGESKLSDKIIPYTLSDCSPDPESKIT